MILVTIFLIVAYSILSLVLIVLVFITGNDYVLLLLYLVLSYFFIRIVYEENLYKYFGIPIYLYLFLPGLGAIVISFVLVSLYYFKRNTFLIQSYEKYIRGRNNRLLNLQFNYTESVQTMSAIDYMTHLAPDLKRQLIISLKESYNKNRISVLKKGSDDVDTEIQHYSAATLNTIENNINKEINRLHEKLEETVTSEVLNELIDLYSKYINSELLSKESIVVFNQYYIQLLEKKEHLFNLSKDSKIELIKGYIRNNQMEKAKKYLEKTMDQYPDCLEFQLIKVQWCYKMKHYHELEKAIMRLKELNNNSEQFLSRRLESQIEFFVKS